MEIRTQAKILVRESLGEGGSIDAKRVAAVCDYISTEVPQDRRLRLLKTYKRMLEPSVQKSEAVAEVSGPVSDATAQSLLEFAQKRTGRTGLNFSIKINPSLLGGVKVSCGDMIWERSASDALSRSI